MNWNDLRLRIRALFRRRRVESELEEEIRAHIELQTRKHMQAGMSVDQARQCARLDFGALENTKEECRDARRVTWFANLLQDLQYAFRIFRRAPGFTGLVVLMLALGIGANVATFSVMDAILLRLLPVKEPGSLFRTVGANGKAYDLRGGGSYKVIQLMRDRTRSLADLMAYEAAEQHPISIGHSGSERLMQQTVSGNYFKVLGVQPAFGRVISPADDQEPGQHAVAVISHRLWKRKFDKSPNASGSELQLATTSSTSSVLPLPSFSVSKSAG
jgi:MacB-like periplasmic core domain